MSREGLVRSGDRFARIRIFLVMVGFSFLTLSGAWQARAETSHIVFLGDSLTAGYGLGPDEGYPERLKALLEEKGITFDLTNAGVSGDTTSGGLSRLDWSVPADADGVVLALGANDALRGIAIEETRKNLETMIVAFKDRGIAVLLAGMLSPPNMGSEYESAFNAIYPELAAQHAVTLYPFLLDGVAAEAALNLDDGIHPNAEGSDLIARRMLPIMEAFVTGLSDSGE